MPRRVINNRTGRIIWVDDDGTPLGDTPMGANPGLGSLPMQALQREIDIASRLPDAQLAGFRGPGVVPPTSISRGGARPPGEEKPPPQTYKPLSGLEQNNRGNSIEFGATSPAGTVSSIVETPRNNGDDAEQVTVTLGYVFNGRNAIGQQALPIRITCILEWGIGNAAFSTEIDWLQGFSFSLSASFVRVKARLETALTEPLIVSAAFSYGPKIQPNSPVRRTIEFDTTNFQITVAYGLIIPIPTFATSFMLIDPRQTFPSANSWEVGYLVNAPTLFTTVLGRNFLADGSNNSDQRETMFTIPNGCLALGLKDNTPGAPFPYPTAGLVIFNLSL